MPDALPAAAFPAASPSPGLSAVRNRIADHTVAPPLTVLRGLGSTPRGLVESMAQARLACTGENVIAGVARPHRGVAVRRALRNPFVLVLLVLGGVSAGLESYGAAAVIGVMVLVSCWLQVRQEHRFDRVAATLRAMVVTTATVVRRAAQNADPVAREIPIDQLVPGDVVRLAPGDMVPADLRLLRSSGLMVDQGVLTGESLPAAKDAGGGVARHGAAGDLDGFGCPWLCFMGGTVTAGSGTGVVTATGAATYFGAMHDRLAPLRAETAFDRGVRGVSRALIGFMACCAPLVFVVNAAVHGVRFEALWFAVSVAVGLTPELLPVLVSTVLARGARACARRGVITKRLPAMHNLGAVDVLCTDKTGTLTHDEVSVDRWVDPYGRTDRDVLAWAAVNSAFAVPDDAADADELDEALLAYADHHLGLALDGYGRVAVIPFDFTRRRATVVVTEPGRLGTETLVCKGAVEQVMACCTRMRGEAGDVPLTGEERRRLDELAEREAADGVRLLAVAVADRPVRLGGYRPSDERELTLVGFVGFRDRPRASAAQAVAALSGRGVAVKILTGDHPAVAARICRDAGVDPGRVVLGEEVALLDATALGELADRATVFARVDPEQKARIVRALRGRGRVVGFLGDGVNDSPALRGADVGVTVGGAVDVARESADVVLMRGDLAAVAGAVTEGRRTFANIDKYLRITLSSNFGNVLSMLAASVLLPFLPILPVQILVQNLCFDLCLLPLAFDRVDERDLRRPRTFEPRRLVRYVLWLGPVNTLADLTAFAALLHITGTHPGPAGQALFHTGWFAANLLTQAAAVHLLRGRGLPSLRNHAAAPVLAGTAVIAAVAVLLPLSPLASLVDLTPLPLVCGLGLAGVLVVYCVLIAGAHRVWQVRRPRRR